MTQIRRRAHQPLGNPGRQRLVVQLGNLQSMIGPEEYIEQFRHGAFITPLVEAQADLPAPENAQVDLRGLGAFDDCGLAATDFQGQGVEELRVEPAYTFALKSRSEDAGQPMDPLRDALEPLWAMVDRVETGDIGQQHLCGADVRVGLLAANVLFTGLQGHAQRNVATGVFRDADNPPGDRPLVLITAGKERRVRTAIPHWHAKPLGRAEHHIRAHFARRSQQQQAQQVSRHAGQCLLRVQVIDQGAQVTDLAVGVGVLQQRAEHLVLLEVIH
ncbi:hypothetical protein D3C84_448100 [compost metagenome]